MCASGSANVQYGHVTDNKLSRQSLRKNRETIREFSCCNKHEIIIRFSHIVGKNAFFLDRVNASCLCFGTCMFCWPRCMKRTPFLRQHLIGVDQTCENYYDSVANKSAGSQNMFKTEARTKQRLHAILGIIHSFMGLSCSNATNIAMCKCPFV